MRARLACVFVCAMLCLLGLGTSVFGQSDVANVTGRVLDPNGAIIIEATVTAKNVDTGVETTVRTNEEGIYRFANLNPGNYEFTVSKRGFKAILKSGVTLHLADTISMNFNMVVGELTEKVTVEAGASMINTTDASISTVVDQSYIKNMPLNGRSLQDLILLAPGTLTQTPQLAQDQGTAVGNYGEFSVNGQRTESNNYIVDGVSGNVGTSTGSGVTNGPGAAGAISSSTALGTTQSLVSVDDLQEFRVESSTYSAEYGRSPGAQIVFETKSGTNRWHGTAYDYLRNDVFDANNWFNNFLSAGKAALRQNDFGGTLGGPVAIPKMYNGKDKSFFFASYEGLRLLSPQEASSSTVPDAALRASATAPLNQVLNAWPVANGPELLRSCVQPTDPQCGAVQPGKEPSGFASFFGAWSNPGSIDSTSVRFDQVVSGKLRLFFRFENTGSDETHRSGFTNSSFPATLQNHTNFTERTYTAGANSIFSSRWSNNFRLNYTSNDAAFNEFLDGFGGGTPVDLLKMVGLGPLSGPQLTINISPYSIGLAEAPEAGAQKQWNFVDTASYSVGRHQFKFGADYRRLAPFSLPNTPGVNYDYESMNSVSANSPDGLFAFISGNGYPLYTNFSAFAADEWKVASRLNLSLGLRWEVNPAPGVTQGLRPYAIQGTGPADWKLAPYGTGLWKTTWYNFAPRLGGAYILRNAAGWETVLRGGGGVFFDTAQQLGSRGFQGPGFSVNAFCFAGFFCQTGPAPAPFPGTFDCSGNAGTICLPTLPPPTTNQQDLDTLLSDFGCTWGFEQHLQLPYTLQWSAGIEQSLGRSQALTVSYVGSRASRLLQQNRYNNSMNQTGAFFYFIENGLSSNYNSLQAQFQRRLSQGLTALASYTWSHCIDYGSTNFDIGYNRGNCDYDVRHNFSSAFSYDVPGVRHGGVLGAVLSHWGLDNRFTARSAFPVNLRGSSYLLSNGKTVHSGVNYDPSMPLYTTQCLTPLATGPAIIPCPGGRGFNPSAFTSTPANTQGTLPRNFLRGFGAWQMDTAIRREFPIHEQLKLQFRAEAFNIFNHPNFGAVNTGLGQQTFGEAQATLSNSLGVLSSLYQLGGPRSMQFALKLVF